VTGRQGLVSEVTSKFQLQLKKFESWILNVVGQKAFQASVVD